MVKTGWKAGANCRSKKCAFAVQHSAPRAASSPAAALRSASRLSAASRERSVVLVAAAGPAVVGVAAPPWPEKVFVGHGDEDRRADVGVAAEHGCNTRPVGKKAKQTPIG